MRVVVSVPFGVGFAQFRLICCLCILETRVVVPGRQSYRILSLTRPLVMLLLPYLVASVLSKLALVDVRQLTLPANAQNCAARSFYTQA